MRPHAQRFVRFPRRCPDIEPGRPGRARREDREAVAEGEADYLFEVDERAYRLRQIDHELARIARDRKLMDVREGELHRQRAALVQAPLDGCTDWEDYYDRW